VQENDGVAGKGDDDATAVKGTFVLSLAQKNSIYCPAVALISEDEVIFVSFC
jgi:hypothetical protein